MSKEFKIYLIKFIFLLLVGGAWAVDTPVNISMEERLLEANIAFDAEAWMEARDGYELLYSAEFYTERMLYRMAWMYEQDQQYAYAIYYLKKAEIEFGSRPLMEDKIKQLMLLQGSSRFFSKDPLRRLRRRFGAVALILFGACIGWYIFHLLYKPASAPVWRKNLNWMIHLLFVPLTLIILWQVFLPVKEAVIVEATSYYAGPGYGSRPQPDAFSPGETVKITDSEDIWYEITIGSTSYWVPKFTVKLL